jgi:hypothetical protein
VIAAVAALIELENACPASAIDLSHVEAAVLDWRDEL